MNCFRSVILLTLISVIGCEGRRVVSPGASTATKSAAGEKKVGATPSAATSEEVLTSAIHQLRPENFGISSNPEKPVSLLNSWRFKVAEEKPGTDDPVPPKAPTGWIDDADQTRLSQSKFDFADALYVRDALFFDVIAGYLSDRGRDELRRVSIVVDFVCRNVSLWRNDEIEIPLNPFVSMQFGRGSAEDRAWICAEILTQLRLDALILRQKADTKETTNKWLLGVVIEQNVYLFDLYLGLPVGIADQNPTSPLVPLNQLIAQPELLERLAVNEPYRLTADDLRDATVHVISSPNSWCARMNRLEEALPTTDACVLYSPLIDREGNGGKLSRIATAGNWPVDSLKLWQFPHRQTEASRKPDESTSQEFQKLSLPFTVPIPFKVDQEGKVTTEAPERKLQRFRSEHLLGKFTEATQRYLSIRHLEVEKNPPDLERLNRMASEDAFYWTCLCKYELADYPGAIDLLSSYIKKYDRKGKWFFPARALLGQSYAELGQFSEAVSAVERTSPDDPYRIGNIIRSKRWTAAQSK
ncbi:tetratricopeptide repeat protein [Schlesneria paludicola]|uniref:tetratricopeptide repeat protein n=1 Tax=Schlesneria paludicola TaxID=360056 RepID=UPI00029A25B0|nr:hypothetical protein [Schlesneria paludicola]